ncbi:MAG: beta-galactosidase [Bacteroidales bacterium]|nr:beta-galactosidase [Bacteroidales bacterium]
MIRPKWQSLNGLWDYAITPASLDCPAFFDGQILVPFCPESSLSGVGKRVGPDAALWYRTSFSVPANWKDRVLLHFDAVDWKAEVWLNGKPLGEHTGGYTAFEYDITDHIAEGEQQLLLKVWDGTDNDRQPRGKQVSTPHGIWYTPVTGIWQSVWLEPVGKTYIKDYNCTSTLAGSITVIPDIEGEADAVIVTLYDGAEGWDAENGKTGKRIAKAQAEPGQALVLEVPEAKLWSPDHPYLYPLSIEVVKDGKVLDKVKAYTAIRSCTAVLDAKGHKRLGLNGEPYFQYGPLDQGWWPDGLYTAPTDDALAYDIVKTKGWGFNFIRKHIKVEPARWYYHCDRLGMMVWQDMPSMAGNVDVFKNDGLYDPQWGRKAFGSGWDYPLSDEAKATYYKEWGEIMHQLKKFPSIVVWVPFNEAWGQFDTEAVVEFTRVQDPTRLINSASGGNHRHCGDILDSHNYPKPKMLLRSDGEMIDVVGEYGGIGYAVSGHTWQEKGNWGYKGVCENGDQVLEKYSRYAQEYLIPGIADGVAAAVYTQTTDVEVEVNGLMTYDRKVTKVNEEQLRKVNLGVIESLIEHLR